MLAVVHDSAEHLRNVDFELQGLAEQRCLTGDMVNANKVDDSSFKHVDCLAIVIDIQDHSQELFRDISHRSEDEETWRRLESK